MTNINLDGISNNLTSVKDNFNQVWSSETSVEFNESLDEIILSIDKLYEEINIFYQAVEKVEIYKKNKERIAELEQLIVNEMANPSLKTTEMYTVNGVEKSRTIYVVDQAKINNWQGEIERLVAENNKLRNEINSLLASINGIEGDLSLSVGNDFSIPENELSYENALELANKFGVPVEYVIGLHLHEDYQIGDRLIPEGINPDVIHYAGENGYPILIDGIQDFGDSYKADAPETKTYFFKNANNFSAVGGGREYNIGGWPITYGEFEGRNTYWTYYGPICQGNVLGVDAAPIQCTSTDLYPCDDGLYRDKDGYIVLAGTPYINQFYQDGKGVNFDANGGMEYEDMFVVTPFGLGRFYDHAARDVPDGIYVDFYMNDGYESNNLAQTDAGRRLRESAVDDYESLDLYWQEMVH